MTHDELPLVELTQVVRHEALGRVDRLGQLTHRPVAPDEGLEHVPPDRVREQTHHSRGSRGDLVGAPNHGWHATARGVFHQDGFIYFLLEHGTPALEMAGSRRRDLVLGGPARRMKGRRA